MKCTSISDMHSAQFICEREEGHKGTHVNGNAHWETPCTKCYFSFNGVLDEVMDDCEIHKNTF